MAYDSTLVVYTGVPLSYINVTPGMNLQTILQNINTAVNTLNPVPNYASFNYGPYYGYTLQTPTGSAITTITGFVTGTANGIGKVSSDLSTFIGTTYANDQTILSNAITALQVPGLAYTHSAGGVTITIANTDTQLQVLTKLANGIGDISDILGAPGSTWSTLSISTPTDIDTAFNSLIAYLSNLTNSVNNKESTIGTFDNSANCLATVGGTNSDSAGQTITLLTSYLCNNTPSFDPNLIVSSCLSTATNLQDQIQQLVNIADDYNTNYVNADGTSIVDSGATQCSGRTFSINPNWSGLGVVKASQGDQSPSNLAAKLVAGTNVSISSVNAGSQLQFDVALPNEAKVAINASDSTPDYLSTKLIGGTQTQWGLGMSVQTTQNNSALSLVPVITPGTFIQTMFDYISGDPDLLAQFCALTTQCNGCTCSAPTDFAVVLSDSETGTFTLTWTPALTGVISQNVKYRLQGDTAWVTGANITAANPQGAATSTATVIPGCTNTIIEFQVDSICGTGSNGTAIVQGIWYAQQVLSANVTGKVISITEPAMPTINTIEYILYSDSTQQPIETVLATGSNPIATFSAVTSGVYYIEYRYSTSINSTIVSSNDVSQSGTYYQSGKITVV